MHLNIILKSLQILIILEDWGVDLAIIILFFKVKISSRVPVISKVSNFFLLEKKEAIFDQNLRWNYEGSENNLEVCILFLAMDSAYELKPNENLRRGIG